MTDGDEPGEFADLRRQLVTTKYPQAADRVGSAATIDSRGSKRRTSCEL